MIWWQMPTCISLYTDMRGVAPSKEPVLKGKHLVRRGIIPLLPYILCPTHCGIIAKVFKYKYTRRLWKKCVSSKSAPRHCVMCPKGVSSQKIVKMRQIGTFLCWKLCTGDLFEWCLQNLDFWLQKGNFRPYNIYEGSVKEMRFLANTVLPKPAQEPPVQSFQQNKIPIYLISTTFWDEITYKHITQWLDADFEETHFFRDAL